MREQLEGLLRAGKAPAVIDAAERHFGGDRAPSPDSLWYAICAMRAAGELGLWGKALDWAEKAAAIKTADVEAQGWIQLYVGNASLYLGNVYRAETALTAFQRLAKRCPALGRLIPFGLNSLANLMRFMKRPEEESTLFRQAAHGFQKLGLERQYLLCRLSAVWSVLLRGLPAPALAELTELEPALAACPDAEVHMNADLARALYESLAGNLAESGRLCRNLLEQEQVPASLAADVLWLLGWNARARGEFALSLRYAAQAHDLAVQDYWPLQIARIEELKRAAVAN